MRKGREEMTERTGWRAGPADAGCELGRPGRPSPGGVAAAGYSADAFPFFLQAENKRKSTGEFGRILRKVTIFSRS